MDLRHWLDGRDFAKYGFLFSLRNAEILRSLKVYPMLTGTPFRSAQWDMYAKLLGVVSSDILNTSRFAHQEVYFSTAKLFPESDLFLDAGTGMAAVGQCLSCDHLRISELELLLPDHGSRVLIVFQSRPNHNYAKEAKVDCAKGDTFRTAIKAKLIGLAERNIFSFAYHDASINFIIGSKSKDRIESFVTAMRDVLGVPDRRILRPG